MAKITIHASMDPSVVAAVDEWARANGISRSSALAVLVTRALEQERTRKD